MLMILCLLTPQTFVKLFESSWNLTRFQHKLQLSHQCCIASGETATAHHLLFETFERLQAGSGSRKAARNCLTVEGWGGHGYGSWAAA